MKRLTFAMALCALPLAGCINVSVGGKAGPVQVITLNSLTPITPDAGHPVISAEALTVSTPLAPLAASVTRIPVYERTGNITYLKGALWADTPPTLFKALLAETIEMRAGRAVLDPRLSTARPGAALSGELIRFGIDEASGQAVVNYDAMLTHEGTTIARRFEAQAPVGPINGPAAAQALNAAANDVADQVADWIKTQP